MLKKISGLLDELPHHSRPSYAQVKPHVKDIIQAKPWCDATYVILNFLHRRNISILASLLFPVALDSEWLIAVNCLTAYTINIGMEKRSRLHNLDTATLIRFVYAAPASQSDSWLQKASPMFVLKWAFFYVGILLLGGQGYLSPEVTRWMMCAALLVLVGFYYFWMMIPRIANCTDEYTPMSVQMQVHDTLNSPLYLFHILLPYRWAVLVKNVLWQLGCYVIITWVIKWQTLGNLIGEQIVAALAVTIIILLVSLRLTLCDALAYKAYKIEAYRERMFKS